MKRLIYSTIKRFSQSQSKYAFLSFGIPFFLFVIAFAIQQVHPFGSRTMLSVDLYHQYAPFLIELRNKVLSGESLLHSWHIGIGTNFWAIYANYSASPLNVLILLFPTKYVPDGIALLVCLRAGLAGLFMSFLLQDTDRGRKDMFLVLFSSFYALSGWVLAYYWNIMWLDAVVLLPLVVLGLRRLIRDQKPFLYCISLFICLWSNFFTGFFVCFFLLFFAPVCYVVVQKNKNWRNFGMAVGRFAFFSLLAGAMAAVILLPTYLTLQHSSATGDAFPNMYLTQDMFDFFSRFMLTAHPNIRDGLANVYSGIPALLFLMLFFICKTIRLSEKIAYAAALLFIYYGFAARVMDFIWHGFHFPNQIPHRQSFLMSFLLVIIAYRVLRNLNSFKRKDILFSVTLILGYILIYPKIGTGKEGFRALALTAIFLVIYAVIIRSILLLPSHRKRLANMFLGVMLVELALASWVTIGIVRMNEGFPSWDFYGKQTQEVGAFLQGKESDADIGPFFRAEIFPHHSCNQSAMYEMKGISVFSSTARESYVSVMRAWGLHNNTINAVRVHGVNEITATLLGVRYFVDLENSGRMPTAFDTNDFEFQGLQIRENPDALSLGYMVHPDVLSFQPTDYTNPFSLTNQFLEKAGAPEVYEEVMLDYNHLENMVFNTDIPGRGVNFSVIQGATNEVEFIISEDIQGRQLYFFTTANDQGQLHTHYIDAHSQIDAHFTMPFTRRQIIDAGRYLEVDELSVRLYWDALSDSSVTINAYTVNKDAYREMVDILSLSEMVVESYDSKRVEGHIEVNEPGLLLLTITYDEGWRAKVNGESAEIINVAGAFCGIMLPEGNHHITLTYTPEGFYEGLLISGLAAVILLMLILWQHIKHNNVKKNLERINEHEKKDKSRADIAPDEADFDRESKIELGNHLE